MGRRKTLTDEERKEKQREYVRAWRAKNRDKCNEYKRKYYRNNKEKVLTKSRIWASNNRDKVRECQRKYEAAHREQKRQYSREHYKLHHAARMADPEYRALRSDYCIKYSRKWRDANKDHIKEYLHRPETIAKREKIPLELAEVVAINRAIKKHIKEKTK